ncbi:MAG TPA: hypothetical protein VHS31_11650 [Tepidisphaeraceae bacterium]|nr:hypothetical protein [Tepidisphaeraceae bacterium]
MLADGLINDIGRFAVFFILIVLFVVVRSQAQRFFRRSNNPNRPRWFALAILIGLMLFLFACFQAASHR